MLSQSQKFSFPIARAFLAAIFILSGFGKIADFAGTQGYMASVGMPATALFLVLAIAVEVVAGLGLLLGFKTRLSALALAFFLVPTTILFHGFWAVPPEAAQMQMIQFMKNLALTGGLLFVSAAGAGAYSLDAYLAKKRSHSDAAYGSREPLSASAR